MDAQQVKEWFETVAAGGKLVKSAVTAGRSTLQWLRSALADPGRKDGGVTEKIARLARRFILREQRSARLPRGEDMGSRTRLDVDHGDPRFDDNTCAQERYKLQRTARHTSCYTNEDALSVAKAAYLLCQPCYDRGTKSFLNFAGAESNFERYTCPGCSRECWVEDERKRPAGVTVDPPPRRRLFR